MIQNNLSFIIYFLVADNIATKTESYKETQSQYLVSDYKSEI